MEAEVQTLLDALADLREKANVNTCFGEPVTIEGRTVIPVARVAYGFGLGVGRGTMTEEGAEQKEEAAEEAAEGAVESTGGGGGGGVAAHPFAVVEVTPEGTQVKPIIDEQKVALAGVLLIGWTVFCLARTLVKIFGRQE